MAPVDPNKFGWDDDDIELVEVPEEEAPPEPNIPDPTTPAPSIRPEAPR